MRWADQELWHPVHPGLVFVDHGHARLGVFDEKSSQGCGGETQRSETLTADERQREGKRKRQGLEYRIRKTQMMVRLSGKKVMFSRGLCQCGGYSRSSASASGYVLLAALTSYRNVHQVFKVLRLERAQ